MLNLVCGAGGEPDGGDVTGRRLKVVYVGISRTNRKIKVLTGYTRSPSLHLKGNWLAEAGFETGRGVTMKINCADGGL